MNLSISIRGLIAVFAALMLLSGHTNSSDEFLVGGDISALIAMEQFGMTYYDGVLPMPAEQIMRKHGADIFRLRVFVKPTRKGIVVQDLPYTIKLAKRIRKTGAKLILTFHYSDTWTNPATQSKPAAWQTLSFEELAGQVRSYTRDTISAMDRENVLPDFVAIGNEIRGGFLWPDGKLDGSEPQWLKFTTLLKSAIAGLEDAGALGKIKVILHVHAGEDHTQALPFFARIEGSGVQYDAIGLSFYPWWGEYERLAASLDRLATAFDKDIFILETAFLHKPHLEPKWPIKKWPWTPSPCGQWQFFRDINHIVKSSAHGKTKGVVWWFPESAEIYGQHIWLAGAASLFDERGRPQPAMTLLGNETDPDFQDWSSICAPGS